MVPSFIDGGAPLVVRSRHGLPALPRPDRTAESAGVFYAAVFRLGRINISADTESFVEPSDHRDREPALSI
jgi:hypothetical protein